MSNKEDQDCAYSFFPTIKKVKRNKKEGNCSLSLFWNVNPPTTTRAFDGLNLRPSFTHKRRT